MGDDIRSSRLTGLIAGLLMAILAVVVIQFLLSFYGMSKLPGGFKVPEASGTNNGIYTVVPIDPGTSGYFGRVILTNKQTGESWIIFPKGRAVKVELPEEK